MTILNPPFSLSPSYLEAESHRYGDEIVYVLPLRTGQYAVLGPMRRIEAIVDTFEEVLEVSRSINWKRPEPTYNSKKTLEIDLGELDL